MALGADAFYCTACIRKEGALVTDPKTPLITPEEFDGDTNDHPWFGTWLGARTEAIGWGSARIRLEVRPEFLREGGSVSGPIVMAVADIAMYAAVRSCYAEGRRAVTSDMTLHFLRRPRGAALIGEGRVLKFGRRLAACRVELFDDAQAEPVAHVVGTYAVPGPD